MHEASLASSVLEYLDTYERNNRFFVRKAVIEVGDGSGANIDALRFCLSEMTRAAGRQREFVFVQKPLIGNCGVCKKEVSLEYTTIVCPQCKECGIKIVSGMELNIIELEGDEIES